MINAKPNWFAFTTKMKGVLLGTAAGLVVAVGGAATDAFSDQPWAVFIPVVIPFILGYLPKEKDPLATAVVEKPGPGGPGGPA